MMIMNLDGFIQEMDNDIEDVNFIISELISTIVIQIPDMELYLKNEDYSSLSREAHSIKGGARNIMANELALSAEELEVAAKNLNKEGSIAGLEGLNLAFNRFENFIRENLHITL